jgi:hypothetical protein
MDVKSESSRSVRRPYSPPPRFGAKRGEFPFCSAAVGRFGSTHISLLLDPSRIAAATS